MNLTRNDLFLTYQNIERLRLNKRLEETRKMIQRKKADGTLGKDSQYPTGFIRSGVEYK